ncbi:MAG: hypothetical protein AAGF11_08920 [Myxococcota bacterium]
MAAIFATVLSLALGGLLTAPSLHAPADPSSNDSTRATVTPSPTTQTAANHPSPRVPALSLSPRHDRRLRPPAPWLRAKRLDRKALRSTRAGVALGGALFGVFYLSGTLGAATELDRIHEDRRLDPEERNIRRTSQLLFVPVIGPLIAAPLGESRRDKAALVALGVLQGLAATALVTGGVILARDRRARRLELLAAPMAGGGSLGVHGRF